MDFGPQSEFARNIVTQKYAHVVDGQPETWEQIAARVTRHVCGSVPFPPEQKQRIFELIRDRKFLPGGRYLRAAGERIANVQNCLLLRADDSREGWGDLLRKGAQALMLGAGIGVDYSSIRPAGAKARRSGGKSRGPLALMQAMNEVGRQIVSPGDRRSAIWAGLNWKHPDIAAFAEMKNWSPEVRTLKEKDYNFPAAMDGTNISVQLDDEFFEAYGDPHHVKHSHAQKIYWTVIRQMLQTAEPGFSVDIGENRGETLRNACVSGDTMLLTSEGPIPIASIVDKEVLVWNGHEWEKSTPRVTGRNRKLYEVEFDSGTKLKCTSNHRFLVYHGEEEQFVYLDQLEIGTKLAMRPIPSGEDVTGRWFDYRSVTVTGVRETGETAAEVFCLTTSRGLAVFNGVLTGQCTEIVSADDSDICNLGSINLARVDSAVEMHEAVELGTMFLLAGTVYSDVPYPQVDSVRARNRRLGLGLMGVHEFLLQRGKSYDVCDELTEFLDVYRDSGFYADRWADEWGLSRPVKTRAIAPTGTIGIVAETTTGIEPIFCVAYKRRYMKGDTVHYQYVVDPTAKRLVEAGVPIGQIEDAYSLAGDVERRVAFQAYVQGYVDHAISSTINLPAWGSDQNNEAGVVGFGKMLMKYLPRLRGITVYPDGARGGQPLTPVEYGVAMRHVGEVFVEQADACEITKAGSCG